MKILIDVNLSRTWKLHLIKAGHDVIHWEDVGPDNADDSEIMAFADRELRTILTGDLDFASMLAIAQMNRPSVVQIRSGSLRPAKLIAQVVEALEKAKEALELGAVVTVMPKHSKIAILPLRLPTQK